MTSKRERYERSNMRGGLGVRKRLSEESLRSSYRLNGVRSGFAVARCYDKYGRWELGGTVGVIVRSTASTIQLRWADDPDNIISYDQGDARYEVDRGRWRILGAVQGNPLDPENPLAHALTSLRGDLRVAASASSDDATPPTEETEMTEKKSAAAREREAAQKQIANGDLKERETYTAKQIATRCGTDAKTMRKFFRSNNSTVEPVGQGGRYEFDSRDFPKIKSEFDAWRNKSSARPKPTPKVAEAVGGMATAIQEAVDTGIFDEDEDDMPLDRVADAIERAQDEDEEPSEEDLAELDGLDLDLDDLDAIDD